ncbi:MAG TPA: hypothetical protein VLJ58_15705 [Ramlibacter sp.]|nr:hypothetical protein [Ramlibacter sp.]
MMARKPKDAQRKRKPAAQPDPQPAQQHPVAPYAGRGGLSGEGASSALAHVIAMEKVRLDKPGES